MKVKLINKEIKIMKLFIRISSIVLMLAVLAGCSYDRVPPAHKGKLLTGSGYQDSVLEPGRQFRWAWQHLILLDTSTQTFTEPMTVILQDRLELDFEVRFRARIAGDDAVINAMFNDIKIDPRVGTLPLERVYNTYGQMIVQNQARAVLNQYSSREVFVNYARISQELAEAIRPALEHTPLNLEDVIIGNIKFPEVVTRAVEVAKERELDIERERAQNEIEMLRRENEKRLAEAEYETRLTRARTIRDENRMIAEGISPDLLKWRGLEIQEKFAESAARGGNQTFIPIESLSNPGAQVRMYQK
jgi:hypothetical protein